MQNRSSTRALRARLVDIAGSDHEYGSLGGLPTSLNSLYGALGERWHRDEIEQALKELHTSTQIYIQHWVWVDQGRNIGQFTEWSTDAPPAFFSDFRLLPSDPMNPGTHA